MFQPFSAAVWRRWLAGAFLIAISAASQAALFTASQRSDILASTQISWGDLGGDGTAVTPPAATGGASVTGASAFSVFQQAPTGSWNGNFADGDSVLALFDLVAGNPVGGEFDISFASPIAGFGTQVQGFVFGPFGVTMDVYDAFSTLLGSFSFAGISDDAGDGSALFVGVLSSSLDIARIVLRGIGEGAGINHLTVSERTVPAPASAALVLLALAGVGALRRRSV